MSCHCFLQETGQLSPAQGAFPVFVCSDGIGGEDADEDAGEDVDDDADEDADEEADENADEDDEDEGDEEATNAIPDFAARLCSANVTIYTPANEIELMFSVVDQNGLAILPTPTPQFEVNPFLAGFIVSYCAIDGMYKTWIMCVICQKFQQVLVPVNVV